MKAIEVKKQLFLNSERELVLKTVLLLERKE